MKVFTVCIGILGGVASVIVIVYALRAAFATSDAKELKGE